MPVAWVSVRKRSKVPGASDVMGVEFELEAFANLVWLFKALDGPLG